MVNGSLGFEMRIRTSSSQQTKDRIGFLENKNLQNNISAFDFLTFGFSTRILAILARLWEILGIASKNWKKALSAFRKNWK